MVHGPVREVVRGRGPLDWSTDRGSVFSGHPHKTLQTVYITNRSTTQFTGTIVSPLDHLYQRDKAVMNELKKALF